jgi:hypothetical protein
MTHPPVTHMQSFTRYQQQSDEFVQGEKIIIYILIERIERKVSGVVCERDSEWVKSHAHTHTLTHIHTQKHITHSVINNNRTSSADAKRKQRHARAASGLQVHVS